MRFGPVGGPPAYCFGTKPAESFGSLAPRLQPRFADFGTKRLEAMLDLPQTSGWVAKRAGFADRPPALGFGGVDSSTRDESQGSAGPKGSGISYSSGCLVLADIWWSATD